MTAIEHTEHSGTEHGRRASTHAHTGEHKPDSFYIKVAVVLAIVTAVEVGALLARLSASCSCRCC